MFSFLSDLLRWFGLGLLTRPSSSTDGLSVPDRWRVTWRPRSAEGRLFVDHYLGGSLGSAGEAARRAGYPWTEQMSRKMSRKVRETRSSGSHTAASARRDRYQAFLSITSRPALGVTRPSRLISHLLASHCRQPEIEAMRGRKRSTRRFAEPLSLRKTLRTFSPIPQFPQTRSFAMNFIGVDLHKKSITICVMDEKRKILARKTVACTQTDEILEFF